MALTPSGSTFAQLRAAGVPGIVERLVAANSLTPAQAELARRASRGDAARQRFVTLLDAYCHGDPVSQADMVAALTDLATALAVVAQAATEATDLVADTPGTVATTTGTSQPSETRRTF